MNWKQFLKPDWRKIVIFVIFLVITVIPFICSIETITSQYIGSLTQLDSFCLSYRDLFIGGLLKPPILGSVGIIIDSLLLIINIIPQFVAIFFNKFLGIFIWLIYWYILSCFTVWIYDKFRKKQK